LENPDPGIHYHAVRAAGTWEVEAAWPHVAALADSDTNKPLRLAAIEALGTIRPLDSVEILANLADSEDEDVAETASEAMSMAEGMLDEEDDDEFADDFVDDDEDEDDDEESESGNHKSIH
jgi:ribonuclease E